MAQDREVHRGSCVSHLNVNTVMPTTIWRRHMTHGVQNISLQFLPCVSQRKHFITNETVERDKKVHVVL